MGATYRKEVLTIPFTGLSLQHLTEGETTNSPLPVKYKPLLPLTVPPEGHSMSCVIDTASDVYCILFQ